MINEDQTGCLIFDCVWVRLGTAIDGGDIEWGPVKCLRCKKQASADFVRPERVVKAVCPSCQGPLIDPEQPEHIHWMGKWEQQRLFAFEERECTGCEHVEARFLPEGEEEV